MNNLTYIVIFLFISLSCFSQESQGQTFQDKVGQDKQVPKKTSREYLRQGNKAYLEDQSSQAEILYRKSLEVEPNYQKANHNLGNSLYNQQKFKEAAAQFSINSKTAKTKSEISESFYNSGNSYMKLKEYGKAVDSYKNSLRINPTDEQARYNLALAKEHLKKQQQDQKNKGDKDKKDDKDKNKDDKKDQDKKEDKEDKKDQEKKDDKKDQDKKDDKSDSKKDKPKPRTGQLSQSQIKQLLEAMNNEEKKTQKKINAKRVKGKKRKQEKDW